MKPLILKGCGTALFTPFRDGKVDEAAMAATVRRQVEAGIHFLVPLGTTGETPCLSVAERQRVLEITRENAPGKTLLVGGGTNSLTATLESMAQLPGADAYLIVVPYYNKPNQTGLYEYYKAVAGSTDKPIVIYNVPGRTGDNITAETTLRLAASRKRFRTSSPSRKPPGTTSRSARSSAANPKGSACCPATTTKRCR